MLHDPSHYEPPAPAEPILLGDADKTVLRTLAEEVATIAADSGQPPEGRVVATAERPGFRAADGVDQRDPLARDGRRRRVDAADRAPLGPEPGARAAADDLPVAAPAGRHDRQRLPRLPAGHPQHRLRDHREVDVVRTDAASDIVSRHFHKQIHDFADLEKIRMPVVTHNEQATEYSYAAMCELYGDILPVRKVGQTHIWFTPWDYLIRWWGIEEAMLDMFERPDLVHAAVERMVDAWMVELDQFVAQNLLSLDCEQHADRLGRLRVHVGLPGTDYDPAVRPAAQHVGLFQRADLLGSLAARCTGSSLSNTTSAG